MGKNTSESIISKLRTMESEEEKILDDLFSYSLDFNYAVCMRDAKRVAQLAEQIDDLADRWGSLLEDRKKLLGILAGEENDKAVNHHRK